MLVSNLNNEYILYYYYYMLDAECSAGVETEINIQHKHFAMGTT
jgi:ferritin-like protein